MKTLSVALLVGMMAFGICTTLFAGTVTIYTQVKYVPGDGSAGAGTPTALYIGYTGGTHNSTCRIKAYIYGSSTSGWTWNGSAWKTYTRPWNEHLAINTDDSGNWNGWIYVKFGETGSNKTLKVVVQDTQEYETTLSPVTALDMSTNGAWVEDSGNPPQGYVVLAYNNSDILGAYAAENNNISEGYDQTSGYWKIAVPAGASITKLEARDSSNNIYATDTTPGWTAGSAGTTTFLQDVTLPVTLSSFAAIPTDSGVMLKWRTESEVDHLGWNIYRSETKDGKFVKINDKLISGAGNSAMPNTYQFVDKTVVKGRQYYYYLEDVDIAGTRNKSSIIPVNKDAKKLTTTWSKIRKGY